MPRNSQQQQTLKPSNGFEPGDFLGCDPSSLVPEYLQSPQPVDTKLTLGTPQDVLFFLVVQYIKRITTNGDPTREHSVDHVARGLAAIQSTAYNLSPGTADRVELCEIVSALRPTNHRKRRLSATLMAFAEKLYRECRWQESEVCLGLIAVLWAGREEPGVFCLLAIRQARLLRRQLRFDEAEAMYLMAASVAEERGNRRFQANALNGLALVYHKRGNLPRSMAVLDRVLEISTTTSLARQRARALQDRSMIYDDMRDPIQALWANLQAYAIDFGDQEERLHILGDVGVKLVKVGQYAQARFVFEKLLDETGRWSDRMNALIELMGIDAEEGLQTHFQARRRWVATELGRVEESYPSMAVDYRVKVAKGLRVFGDVHEANRLLAEALTIAEEHGLNRWIFEVEELLKPAKNEPVSPAVDDCELKRFGERLYELAVD